MYSMFGTSSQPPAVEAEPEKPSLPESPMKETAAPNDVTYLAQGSLLQGKLQTEGNVEIAGSFNGDIAAKGKVVLRVGMQGNIMAESLQLMGCKLTGNVAASGTVALDETATVIGNVVAGELICSGKIKGDLDIKGNLALNEKAWVEGNIVTQTMTMSRGAVVVGGVKMGSAEP